MHRILALLLLLPAGCVGITFERTKIGVIDPIHEARRLEAGKVSLRDTLARLGPPDLILRAGRVNRAYYTYWDSDFFKFIIKISLSVSGRGFSWDIFILSSGTEELHLARLDFDAKGMLVDVQTTTFSFTRGGEYAALDNTLVSNFLEDRERALEIEEEEDDDDDEEDVEPDPKD